MTKELLASLIQKKGDLETRVKAEAVHDAVLATIREELAAGRPVGIRDFGTFSIVERSARKGRNPRTGATVEIPASRTVRFLPGKSLKRSVQEAGEETGQSRASNRQFTRQMEERLREIKATIDGYLTRGEGLGGEARRVYQESVKPKYEEARLQFKLLRASSGDVWDEMRVGFERAYAELREAFQRARKKV